MYNTSHVTELSNLISLVFLGFNLNAVTTTALSHRQSNGWCNYTLINHKFAMVKVLVNLKT